MRKSLIVSLILTLAFGFMSARAADETKPMEVIGVPLSLVYAAKIDGPNNHIAFTIMMEVAGKRVPAIFEGKPQHPVLDALSAVQAEINDGDNETITIEATLLGSVPNATYPHGLFVISQITVGDYVWQKDYFDYKG